MNRVVFISQLERAYNQSYSSIFVQSMNEGLSYVNEKVLDQVIKILPKRFSVLPSVKNVLAICSEVSDNMPRNIVSKNKYQPKDCGLDNEIFWVWIAPLLIQVAEKKLLIKSPFVAGTTRRNRFFELYIMENLGLNLVRIEQDIEYVEWLYDNFSNKYFFDKKNKQFSKIK